MQLESELNALKTRFKKTIPTSEDEEEGNLEYKNSVQENNDAFSGTSSRIEKRTNSPKQMSPKFFNRGGSGKSSGVGQVIKSSLQKISTE